MKSQCSLIPSRFSLLRRIAALLAVIPLIALTSCGSDSSTPPPPTATTAVQINLGDAPSQWMLAFSMKVSSMSLIGNSTSVPVNGLSIPFEMIHRMGTMEPIAIASIPQGTYTGASVTVASCKVTYMDPVTKTLKQKTLTGPFSASVQFPSSVTVGTTPYAFNFDLDLEHSLTVDNSGNFQFSPQFHFSNGKQGTGSNSDARYGGVQQMMGVVSGVSNTLLSVIPLQTTHAFTFSLNAQTQFRGTVQSREMLQTGMGVIVNATLQSDGTLLATRVTTRMNSGGIMGGGIITEVTGQPATELTLVMQNGAGASLMSDYLSEQVTIGLLSTTKYEIDDDRIDLSSLPIEPVFDASNIYAGQSVLPIGEDGIAISGTDGATIGTITAAEVRLQEQGFRGTTDVAITPGTSQNFVLTLLPECAFTTLTGAESIVVYQLTGTNVEDDTAIPAGATLRVHGLLFKNAGQWTLIASRIASS